MKTKHIDTLTFQHSSLGCWESIVHLQKCLDFEILKCCQWVNHIFSRCISGGSLHRSPLWYKSPFLPTAVNRENSTHLPSSSAHWALQHCTCPVSAEGFLPEYWRGSCSLLWGIFPTQGLNPGLPHCGWILHQLRHQRSPRILEWVAVSFSRGSSDPGIEPGSLALQADSSLAELPGKPLKFPREVQTRKCAHTHTHSLFYLPYFLCTHGCSFHAKLVISRSWSPHRDSDLHSFCSATLWERSRWSSNSWPSPESPASRALLFQKT